MFSNLHTHTDYSVLDGMMSANVAFKTAKGLGYSALAITEHANMSSIFIALRESIATGLQYVPGIEFNMKDTESEEYARHLVVLASNERGLKSIMKLAYKSYARDVDKPYILWDDLGDLDAEMSALESAEKELQ